MYTYAHQYIIANLTSVNHCWIDIQLIKYAAKYS